MFLRQMRYFGAVVQQFYRGSTADEIANVTELLMSNRGAFITGADFLADGGATASYFYGPLRPERV